MKKTTFLLVISLILFVFCLGSFLPSPRAEAAENPPLSFWNEGNTKQEIMDFVGDITNPESTNFVDPSDRIAVFDNDGTLLLEKPCFFEEAFFVYQQGSSSYCLTEEKEIDVAVKDIEINQGLTTDQYKQKARNFLETQLHPDLGVPYIQLTYKPMVQLLDYLRENQFQIYISSGAEIDFIRSFAEDAYQIPPKHTIGTSFVSKFEIQEDGKPVIIRLGIPLLPLNNYAGKAVGIQRYIGKKPILTVGNGNNDVAMLQYTDDGEGRDLMMLVHHDDGDREYQYDEGAETLLAEAEKRGWIVISVKNDFKQVFEDFSD